MKQRIREGFNPNDHRGRGKRSYLEVSFSHWLSNNFPNVLVEQEAPFKRKDHSYKTYYVDFYFPSIMIGIELDGSQHNDSIEYDEERDRYIKEVYGVQLIRITHAEYKSKTRIEEIVKLLSY